jgi:hypothetical protein
MAAVESWYLFYSISCSSRRAATKINCPITNCLGVNNSTDIQEYTIIIFILVKKNFEVENYLFTVTSRVFYDDQQNDEYLAAFPREKIPIAR